jgi:hypothetical protein
MNTPDTSQPIAQKTWTVVSQCKSDRVVYFTDDPQYQPPMEGDWYYCSTYLGELPAGLTLRNCWGWRFRGSQFLNAKDPVKATAAEKLFDNNQRALLRLLKEKIDEIRKPFAPSCLEGQFVREFKLKQAQSWLSQLSNLAEASESKTAWTFLSQVAQARECSLEQAARLVVARAKEQETVWLETERFREQLTLLIKGAKTQVQLMEIREWLLDAVYPELSHQFKYPQSNTEPMDASAALSTTARLHEITRLKSQLRESINAQRKYLHSNYVLGEQVWQHKLKQAQQWLAYTRSSPTDVLPAGYELLQSYALANGLTLEEAANALLSAAATATETLLVTERIKDQLLAQIDRLNSYADVQEIELALKNLEMPMPSSRSMLS